MRPSPVPSARREIGRRLYALGGNPEAARLSGIPVHRTLASAYALCGLLAGLAGVLSGVILVSRLAIGQPTAAGGYELDVIAAQARDRGREPLRMARERRRSAARRPPPRQKSLMGLIIPLAVLQDRNLRR